MQQTQNYKFNLIEASDTFSPNPLNENMEKLEGALEGIRTEAAGASAALDQRLQVFEAHRFAMGTYKATSGVTAINITLDFTPKLVLIHGINGHDYSGMLYREQTSQYHPRIVANGILIPAQSSALNYQYGTYLYLAFG